MKIDLIASGGGRYRVMRDGAELSAHTAQHTALAAGIAAKQATPASLIEVVTDFRVRVEITGATAPAPTPDPVPEPTPDPVPPVVTLPPISKDGTLLRDIAAELAPGEWRRVDTKLVDESTTFKGMQTVSAVPPATGSADGMGWTEDLVEYKGTLMLPLMRDTFAKALIIMDARGQWVRINTPPGLNATTQRRPFNRWFRDEVYAYFALSYGEIQRTPLDNPGQFETFGVPIGDGQMDWVGNYAACVAKGRFWAYTPGGKLRSWAHGEPGWTDIHTHMAKSERPSGYAGSLQYNPVKNEIFAIGGQYFGANPDISYRGWRADPDDHAKPATYFEARLEDGTPIAGLTSAQTRLLYHARTGEYLMLHHDGRMYRSETGEVWRPYEDLTTLKPWGRYEQYCPWTYLENTDVIAMVSHIMGVWLHKVKG